MLFASLIHNKRQFPLFHRSSDATNKVAPESYLEHPIYQQLPTNCSLLFSNNHQTTHEVHVVIFDMGWDEKKRAALKQDLGAARLTFKNLYLFPLLILQHITFLPNLMFDLRRQRFCCWSFIIAVFVLFPTHSLNELY